EHVLAAAIACGDHIVKSPQSAVSGSAWRLAGTAYGGPLTGMAYGAAGIAYALLQLAGICGDGRFRAAALDATTYERGQFCLVAGTRPDLHRTEADEVPRFQTAWCHGAPGIGLARLCSLPFVDDVAIRAEIDAALATTLTTGFGRDHSLCHGDLGRL